MNVVDIVICVLLAFGFYKGFSKGLFVEIASLLSLVLGIYGAIHFSYLVSDYISDYLDWEERYITICSFGITFIAIVIVISLAGKLLTKIANFAFLGTVNKIAGGIFGVLKVALILSVTLIVFDSLNNFVPILNSTYTEESFLFKPVKEILPTLFPNFVSIIENKVSGTI